LECFIRRYRHCFPNSYLIIKKIFPVVAIDSNEIIDKKKEEINKKKLNKKVKVLHVIFNINIFINQLILKEFNALLHFDKTHHALISIMIYNIKIS